MSVDDWHCEMGQVQSPQIMSIVSWQHLNEILWIPLLHLSQLFNPSIHVKPLFGGAGWDGRT